MSKQAAAKKRADPLFRAKLRQKFIDTAHKYIGVVRVGAIVDEVPPPLHVCCNSHTSAQPYAQKYHEPGSELYNAPLFLDCCGLVRQVMDDLQDEFGFRIGRWNQAYMFDTLPKKLSFEDLKPGDLVFYSGTPPTALDVHVCVVVLTCEWRQVSTTERTQSSKSTTWSTWRSFWVAKPAKEPSALGGKRGASSCLTRTSSPAKTTIPSSTTFGASFGVASCALSPLSSHPCGAPFVFVGPWTPGWTVCARVIAMNIPGS